MKYILSLSILLVCFASCKKSEPFHSIPDEMKQYFNYQMGSYWIYKDDSTGTLDSTYVNFYYHTTDDHNYAGMRRESLVITLTSQFLTDFDIYYTQCTDNVYATAFCVGSKIHNYPNETETGGAITYCAEWQPNITITNGCLFQNIFIYKIIPTDTINNIVYKNVLYSKIISIDSSSTNPYYYYREIYFAKHIGLVKYFEIYKYYNIHRSWSLLREKIIQY